MKYWIVFVLLLTTAFGGFCVTAIKMSNSYLEKNAAKACYFGDKEKSNCDSIYIATVH